MEIRRCVMDKCNSKVYTVCQNAQLMNTDQSFLISHASDGTLKRKQTSNFAKKSCRLIVENSSKKLRKGVSI